MLLKNRGCPRKGSRWSYTRLFLLVTSGMSFGIVGGSGKRLCFCCCYFFFTRREYSLILNVIKMSVFNAFRSLSKALFTHNFLSCTILSGELNKLIYAHYVTLMVFLIGKIARMCGYWKLKLNKRICLDRLWIIFKSSKEA